MIIFSNIENKLFVLLLAYLGKIKEKTLIYMYKLLILCRFYIYSTLFRLIFKFGI